MPTGTILLLGAFAGLTIFFGLPFARLRNVPPALKTFMSMVATGVLVFLLYDVVAHIGEPIDATLTALRVGGSHAASAWALLADVALFVLGLGLGTVGLVAFNRQVIGRLHAARPKPGQPAPAVAPNPLALASIGSTDLAAATKAHPTVVTQVTATTATASRELTPEALALVIATGIGLHNFSEGLAIGQSAANGALQLALILIIGFGLHNMTEGFGIAGPLTNKPVSWRFLGLLGLIGGGPTFLGTAVGMLFHSPQVSILFLALAAGAIIYVIVELLGVAKRSPAQYAVMSGLILGFMLGYLTDMIITYAGA